jgi:hypothetical protein
MSPLPNPAGDRTKLMVAASFTLAFSAVFLGVSIVSYLAVTSRNDLVKQRSHMAMLDNARQSKNDGNFAACMAEASKIPVNSSIFVEAKPLLHACQKPLAEEQLRRVQQLRSQGKLEDAIALVAPLVAGVLDGEARPMMEEMAPQLFETAKRSYWSDEPTYLNNALFSLNAIPQSSAYFPAATTQKRTWLEERAYNYSQLQLAEAELQQENVTQVEQALAQVSSHPFWQKEVAIKRQELSALKTYREAQTFMQNKEWENAIAIALTLPDAMPWSERKSNLVSRARATLQRQEICKTLTLGLVSRCYR